MVKFAAFALRGWPHIVGAIGAIALALSPLYVDWLRSEGSKQQVGDLWAIIVLIFFSLLALVGSGVGVYRYEKRLHEVQVGVMVGLRASFVPVVERLMQLPPDVDETTFGDVMTEAVARVSLFAKKDDDQPDANMYVLEGQQLVRVNRAAGTARETFSITEDDTDRAVEESRVVQRVLACERAVCGNVRSRRIRKRLGLAKTDRTYRSFISVPILKRDRTPFGMISLNSTKKNGLSDLHITYLENLARVIGALEAVNS